MNIDAVIDWAKGKESIRAAVLVGSRARERSVDALADYDLSLFLNGNMLFIQNDDWLSEIGNVWICVHEKLYWESKVIATRLAIFEGGLKVDFSFFPLEILQELVNNISLPSLYDMGYKVLIDKDELAVKLPKLHFKGHLSKLTAQEYDQITKEFWFEAYHVAVYLKRGDVWSAKVRMDGIQHHFLLKILDWHEHLYDSKKHIPPLGKHMQMWLSDGLWKILPETSANLDALTCWNALFRTIQLFRQLAQTVAQRLHFSYPHEIDDNLSSFISKLHDEL